MGSPRSPRLCSQDELKTSLAGLFLPGLGSTPTSSLTSPGTAAVTCSLFCPARPPRPPQQSEHLRRRSAYPPSPPWEHRAVGRPAAALEGPASRWRGGGRPPTLLERGSAHLALQRNLFTAPPLLSRHCTDPSVFSIRGRGLGAHRTCSRRFPLNCTPSSAGPGETTTEKVPSASSVSASLKTLAGGVSSTDALSSPLLRSRPPRSQNVCPESQEPGTTRGRDI